MSISKLFMMAGALGGFLSVALGAFAAHALKSRLDDYSLGVFKTGVEYQFLHSIVLLWLSGQRASQVPWAGSLLLAGIFIFSGSLYLLAFTGVKTWGAVTPIGGVLFLIAWAVIFFMAATKG